MPTSKIFTLLLTGLLCCSVSTAMAQVGTGRSTDEVYDLLKLTYPESQQEDSAEEASQFTVHEDFEINLLRNLPWW
ncbi:MAG: hypothetical protein R3C11_02380 [Planctomycetaceae bacterium]